MYHKTLPIEITSDYGNIGNICWVNSKPAPHPSIWMRQFVTYWGFTMFGRPKPGIMYGFEIPYKPLDYTHAHHALLLKQWK
jgi:hypothetical protein